MLCIHKGQSFRDSFLLPSDYIQAAATKIPQTEWCINNRNSLLTVLEAGNSKVKVPADLCLGQVYSLFIGGDSYCGLTWQKVKKAASVTFHHFSKILEK